MPAHHDRTGNNVGVGSSTDIELGSNDGRLLVGVSPREGGRIASLSFDGSPLIVERGEFRDPLAWGCYPMVPYCGRVRDAILHLDGERHPLAMVAPPHAIHGTVFDRSWDVTDSHRDLLSMSIDLGELWPRRGRVEQRIEIRDHSLHLQLMIAAVDDMPWMIGWHPWFVKPIHGPDELILMHRRDEAGIATDELVPRPAGVVDDCFIARDGVLTMRFDRVKMTLASDCERWVIYDEPTHATCVEPQSGPPNEVNDSPRTLRAGESVSRWFRIEVSTL